MAEASPNVSPEIEERRAAIVLSPNDVSTLAEQLNDVAGKWELFLGLLKVSPAKQEQIKSSRANHPAYAQICLVDGLQYWVVSDPSPTVEKVIAALSSRTINNKLLAAEIARKWGIQAFVENPAPELRSICTAASELAITRPDSQLPFDKLQAEAKSTELRKRFISLVNHLKRHLKESITDAGLSKFREEFILELPFSVREENEKFFDRKNTEINKAATFDELFTCLSTHWSYLNRSLLGGIILRYGTEELKDNIKAFSCGVDEFRKGTTIEIFQEIEPPPRVVPPAGFQEFVTKHSLSLTSTLEDIECIRHEFCKKFHLHTFAFYLVRVLKGSVLITWLVPHSVARLVQAGMTHKLMRELSIEDIIYTDTKSSEKKDECPSEVPIAPIRGCTVVAERNFPITQKAEVFNWSEYGITISAPENSIPEKLANTQSILLNVRVSLSGGPFQLGAPKLMSAVYWLCSNIRCKFAKPLELTVEHCAHLKHSDDHTKLTFLRTKCSQEDLPYKFEEIGGRFTVHSGTVALRIFSGVAVGSKSAKSVPPVMKYLARLVIFQTHVNEWKALFTILKDLKCFRAFDSAKNLGSNRFTTTYTSLKVMEDTVRLDLPVDGVTVEDGNWKILPLVPPRLSIPDGETCEPFRDFAECSFVIEWVGSGHPSSTLHHVVKILGTADKDDFFVLHVNPAQWVQQPQETSTLSTQPRETKHRAIEELVPDLVAVICGKSDPEVFAEHLAAKGFLSTQIKSKIMGTKEKPPHSTVSRLLNAVVVTIKMASSPEESEKHFDNFVTIIRKELELEDLAQKLLKRCAELDAAATLSAEASAPFTTAPVGSHQVTTAPQLNPLSPTGSPQKRTVASAAANTTTVVNSPVPQAKPTKPELKDALKMLLPLHKDWKTIGALLGMEEEKLSAIQDKQDNISKDCLRVMLDGWLKSTAPPPSWQALADAVESIYSDTADNIRREYIL